jgi:hypothetical protein
MAAKLTRLTHKIAIHLHLVAEIVPFAVLAPGGQSGNFWIHPHIFTFIFYKVSSCSVFSLTVFFFFFFFFFFGLQSMFCSADFVEVQIFVKDMTTV